MVCLLPRPSIGPAFTLLALLSGAAPLRAQAPDAVTPSTSEAPSQDGGVVAGDEARPEEGRGAAEAASAPSPSVVSDSAAPREAAAVAQTPQPYSPPDGSRAGTTSRAAAITPGLEVFARYGATFRETSADPAWDHAFDVPRVHASLTGRYEGVEARVLLEGVRSTAQGALVGVATDSILLRLREARIGYHALDDALEVQLGIVPLLTIPALESAWGLRVVAPTPLEESALAVPADLGARVTLTLPARLGWVGLAGTSGEGYASRELNRGKNTEFAAELHPLASVAPALAPLALLVSGVWGSQGVGSTRAHRLTAGLLWRGDFREGARSDAPLAAGVAVTSAWGVEDVAAREALLIEAFARTELFARVLVAVRFVHFLRDRRVDADRTTTALLSVGVRVAAPLELHLALTRDVPASAARAALPGSDRWDLALNARALF
jgi:hypothetical protein